jgi:[acyl-carrier-protein] S-malonyltransferase
VHNADVKSHVDEAGIKDALARQLYSPVRWVETVRSFADQGIDTLAECGPGKVLAGLNKRIDGNMQAFALSDEEALRQAMDTLK